MPALVAPDPPLTDGVVVVRERTLGDVDAITAACQDPEIPRWTRVPASYTRADALAFHHIAQDEAASGTALHLVVAGAAGELLGAVGLHDVDAQAGAGDIGYWLAAHARGRGIGTRAVVLLRDWAVATVGLRRLTITVHPGNEASRRVAERAGFRDGGERAAAAPRRPDDPPFLVYVFERP